MIHCVSFAEIEAALDAAGFEFAAQVGTNRYYARSTEFVTIHEPNVDGNLPEIVANDAFDTAGIPIPAWRVFWCD